MTYKYVYLDRQVVLDLIDGYRQHPCLWHPRDANYTNRHARGKAYEALLKILQQADASATMDKLKKKLEHLRTAARRERKRVDQSMRDALSPDDIRKPSLFYYEDIQFIFESEGENWYENTDASTKCEDLETEDFADPYDDGSDDLPLQLQSKPKKKKRKHQRHSQDVFGPQEAVDNDEATSFGRTTGLQMKSIETVQRQIAEKLISDVIFLGRLQKLTLETKIVTDFL